MTLKEKLDIAIEKGFTCNPDTGKVFLPNGKEIKNKDKNGKYVCVIRIENKKYSFRGYKFIEYYKNKNILDNIGFEKGHKESIEVKLKRIESLKKSWENRKDYISDIKNEKFYNIWRSFMFTNKGKNIGCSENWKSYRNFFNEMYSLWQEGLNLVRIDKTGIFCKDNCIFLSHKDSFILRDDAILLEYNGIKKSLIEWSFDFKISKFSIKNRYHKRKEKKYTNEEILFGRIKKIKNKITSAKNLIKKCDIRSKASKMISSYRIKDKKRGYENDLTIDWLIENILFKKCVYCGDEEEIGADRIDNSKGHIKTNVQPCCYTCNRTRGDSFSVEEMKLLALVIKKIKKQRIKTLKKCQSLDKPFEPQANLYDLKRF